MVRKQRINETKARLKSGKTHLKVMPRRPCGRCEMTFSMPSPDFLNGFARLFALFYTAVSLYIAFCINSLILLWQSRFYPLYVL